MRYPMVLLISILLPVCISCGFRNSDTAILWTDRPEFAIYTEYFNSSQDQYKIETRYFESAAQKLTDPGVYPDIVVGNWLKSTSTRNLFRPLDSLFNDQPEWRNSFYPALLALGNIEGKQYLLPISFNLPALIFSQDNSHLIPNPFTISLEEIKELGGAYNIENPRGVYSRMGFSPAWNDDFLFVAAVLFGASFREAQPLTWNPGALEKAITYIRRWIQEANTSIQAEDDFTFKYFYDSPAKLALSGRILFAYMESSTLFTLTQERRASLDFRWIAENNTIPLAEGTVYYGIHKKGGAKKASAAFTRWFFQESTQRLLLEASRNNRLNETLFGIGNGFSGLRTVTEQIFPQFYPGLLGHIPSESFLSPPNILPRNWMVLKERVILPYLHEQIRYTSGEEPRSLERRLVEWNRLNREW